METQIGAGFRLSPQQKRLWSLQPDRQTYNAWSAIRLRGDLAPNALRESLAAVVQRHQILRTSFQRLPGTKFPLQVVNETANLDWTAVDLSTCDERERETEVGRIFAEEKRRPFELERESLLRALLLTLSTHEHLLLLTLPSLCADSRTLTNIYLEISRNYGASHGVEKSAEDALPYIQFSEWQNELLDDENEKAGREFWLKHDLAAAATLALPFELDSQTESSLAMSSVKLQVEPQISSAISAVAESIGVPLSVALLSCWQILLWRLTGEPGALVVGCAFDGRAYEELQEACGLFAKYLPLQARLDETVKFKDHLMRVEAQWRDAGEWQEYFSWEAVDHGDERDASLGHFAFGYEFTEREAELTTAELAFSIVEQGGVSDRFKVKLSCTTTGDSLLTSFQYDSKALDRKTVERLAQQFRKVLESAGSNSDALVGELEILSDAERAWLSVVNSNQRDFPRDKCFHHLFEDQVERTPDASAVVFEDQQLTYRELNDRANQLAHFLQSLGVKPEVRVGILCERSAEMITALIGVAKAGGVYVPLDTAFPKERLGFMLRDAQVKVLLTQERLLAGSPEHAAQIVCLDANWPTISRQQSTNPSPAAAPENLCYILYTSGSTGDPKGVAVEHRQLVNYLHSIREILSPASQTFATVSTLAADLGNTVIFPALCGGGILHVISQERASNAAALASYIAQHHIDCVKIVPSHLSALLSSLPGQQAQLLPGRELILGGEASRRVWAEELSKLSLSCRILNHYGPTETTVGVLTHLVHDKSFAYTSATLPLGHPLANARVYILDQRRRVVPIGIAGELHVGGHGLTRGYWKRPELTAEKFIPDPFSGEPGARLYSTGDLARYLPNGEIEFLGRLDHQVKIRGYRIELGEIETVLSKHPAVREAVVVREDNAGETRLVAYVVRQPPRSIGVSELRAHLRERLPEYMTPAAFVELKALPLSANGKIDRQSLPAPELVNTTRAREFIAPRTEAEQTLVKIWSELLKVEQVSIDDNFFELGGHSLLATQLISRVREEFKLELPLSSLFEYPTVSALAVDITRIQDAQGEIPLRTIAPIELRPKEDVLARLNELSAEEVEAHLASLLSEGRG